MFKKYNDKNLNFFYILGMIDGVLKRIQEDKEKVKNEPFSVQLFEEEEKKWIDFRKELFDKITLQQ